MSEAHYRASAPLSIDDLTATREAAREKLAKYAAHVRAHIQASEPKDPDARHRIAYQEFRPYRQEWEASCNEFMAADILLRAWEKGSSPESKRASMQAVINASTLLLRGIKPARIPDSQLSLLYRLSNKSSRSLRAIDGIVKQLVDREDESPKGISRRSFLSSGSMGAFVIIGGLATDQVIVPSMKIDNTVKRAGMDTAGGAITGLIGPPVCKVFNAVGNWDPFDSKPALSSEEFHAVVRAVQQLVTLTEKKER